MKGGMSNTSSITGGGEGSMCTSLSSEGVDLGVGADMNGLMGAF